MKKEEINQNPILQEQDKVQVFVRIRPQNDKDKGRVILFNILLDYQRCVFVEGNNIKFGVQPESMKPYTYDQVAPENASQLEIFEKVGLPIADNFIDGK
jgi:hypothetical protein